MFLAHLIPVAVVVLAGVMRAQAKAVFAHFIVGVATGYSDSDWDNDISAAHGAGIDGFALNIGDPSQLGASLAKAYMAADKVPGFYLFISFDYAAYPGWTPQDVISGIETYQSSSSQYRYGENNQTFVSTFEGTEKASDWVQIKSQTGCFFVPDWTSLGANNFGQYLSDVDGAFSWDAWPAYPESSVTTDQGWKDALGSKPYMMGVSPWFYTNLPAYSKNWLWGADGLWHDRWQQVIELQPELVEIISWNDYGESHYIGPLHPSSFPTGSATYVDGMPHDDWRELLPFYIAQYKNGNITTPNIAEEKAVYYYRTNPSSSGSTGGTTGNTATQGQPEYPPEQVSLDKVHLDVLVNSQADVSVQIGENSPTKLSASTAGVNHFFVYFNGQVGNVTITLARNGQTFARATGPAIIELEAGELINWNAYVGSTS